MKRVYYFFLLCVFALSIKAQTLNESQVFTGSIYATPARLVAGDETLLQLYKYDYTDSHGTISVLNRDLSINKTIACTDIKRLGYKNYDKFECPKDDFYIVQNVFVNDNKYEYIDGNSVYNEDGEKLLDLPDGYSHCIVIYGGKLYLSIYQSSYDESKTTWYEIVKPTVVNAVKSSSPSLKVSKVIKDNHIVISDGKGNEYNVTGTKK